MAVGATIATAVWVMLPAYVPNNTAVIAGGGHPIDGGRTWRGRRLLGDGKTWRGTMAGIIVGTGIAFGLNMLQPSIHHLIGISLPVFTASAAIGLPVGAMVGDMAASFVKRRTGRERGAPFPGVDQLDFVAGALILVAIIATDWFMATFTLPVIVTVLVLTPILHVGTNAIGYFLGFKQEPY